MSTRAGFVAFVGITSAGKSSLINALVGEKVAIVSGKPQSTRKPLQVILTEKNVQLVLVDTPGLHAPRNRLGEFMMDSVVRSLKGVDRIVFVTRLAEKLHLPDELASIVRLGRPVDLVCSQADRAPALSREIADPPGGPSFAGHFVTSTVSGEGIAGLREHLQACMPESPFFYPEDELTDATSRFIVEEFVREAVCRHTRDELPFGVVVQVTEYRERGDGLLAVEAMIFCERESHKSMLIGRGGQMIKRIGQDARKLLETFSGQRVHLALRIKVRPGWRKNETWLRQFGYHD